MRAEHHVWYDAVCGARHVHLGNNAVHRGLLATSHEALVADTPGVEYRKRRAHISTGCGGSRSRDGQRWRPGFCPRSPSLAIKTFRGNDAGLLVQETGWGGYIFAAEHRRVGGHDVTRQPRVLVMMLKRRPRCKQRVLQLVAARRLNEAQSAVQGGRIHTDGVLVGAGFREDGDDDIGSGDAHARQQLGKHSFCQRPLRVAGPVGQPVEPPVVVERRRAHRMGNQPRAQRNAYLWLWQRR